MGSCCVKQGDVLALTNLGGGGMGEGREAYEGGDTYIYIYIYMTDYLYYTAETNTTLQSNYPPVNKGDTENKRESQRAAVTYWNTAKH